MTDIQTYRYPDVIDPSSKFCAESCHQNYKKLEIDQYWNINQSFLNITYKFYVFFKYLILLKKENVVRFPFHRVWWQGMYSVRNTFHSLSSTAKAFRCETRLWVKAKFQHITYQAGRVSKLFLFLIIRKQNVYIYIKAYNVNALYCKQKLVELPRLRVLVKFHWEPTKHSCSSIFSSPSEI